MTRQEIAQALHICGEGRPCRDYQLYGEEITCVEKLCKYALGLIERLTAENAALRENVPRWVSVEGRRPEPGKRVLATDGVFVGEAYRTSADTWRRYDGIAMRDCLGSVVTHWMPLPDAKESAGARLEMAYCEYIEKEYETWSD